MELAGTLDEGQRVKLFEIADARSTAPCSRSLSCPHG
jgi:hypothetical protein